jgi:hypothetical protein
VVVDDPGRSRAISGKEEGSGVLYRIDIAEVVLTRVGDPPDHLLVQVWAEDGGLRTLKAS